MRKQTLRGNKRREQLDGRLLILAAVASLWMCAIGIRLIRLQVYQSQSLRLRAERQQQRIIETAPLRGMILDRSGHELARSIEEYSVYLAPAEAKDIDATVSSLSSVLGIDKTDLEEKLRGDRAFIAVKRKAPAAETDRLQVMGLPGVHLIKEYKRFYPKGSLASCAIGFVNAEDRGQAGLEMSYDDYVRGEPGHVVMQTDALRRSYDREEKDARPGQNLQLTLDDSIQYFAEKELESGVQRSNAKSGAAIVLRPRTGEILALASYPSFDPNDSNKSDWSRIRNRAAELSYEPGSVMKIVTYSAALEEEVINAGSMVDAQGGSIVIAGHTIRDSGKFGTINVPEAIERSNNVVAIKVGEMLGADRLVKYLRLFGFGERSDPDFPNETAGVVRDAPKWSPASFGSVPIGYEVGVTPMQMAAAIATIANDGIYVQPHIVQKIISPAGEVLVKAKPETRRVLRAETARSMRSLLEGVVLRGTGKKAKLQGYSAAGKTGTARKFDLQTRRYSTQKYFASFAGLAPAGRPEIAVVVVLEEPKGAYHGGDVAAPVFQQIAQITLEQLNVPPDQTQQRPAITATIDTRGAEDDDLAEGPFSELGEMIAQVADKRPVLEATVASLDRAGSLLMPDLLRRGGRNAADLCAALGLKLKASGSGVVVKQIPEPGEPVQRGAICYVELRQ